MSATVLALEMVVRSPVIDLRMASELVLSDIGATIQILRLVERAFDCKEERPYRMSDCLASFGAETWFAAISAFGFSHGGSHTAATALWRHCHLIAQYTQLLSEWLEHVSPEDAYLVGLLHGIDAMSPALDWPQAGQNVISSFESVLPSFVCKAMRSVKELGPSSDWGFLLRVAHDLAGAPEYGVVPVG